MSNTATFVRKLDTWVGDARLYHVDPEARYDDGATNHVIVSAVVAPFSGPETYIFPSTPEGEPINFGELDGSFRGGLDHVEALEGAGYTVVKP